MKIKHWIIKRVSNFQVKLWDESGQGTTEYAILVGVLVVIAILAIVIFKPKYLYYIQTKIPSVQQE